MKKRKTPVYLNGTPKSQLLEHDNTKKILLEDFTVIDIHGKKWTAPKGYISDGTSVPPSLEPLIGDPFAGVTETGAWIHDYYCDTKERSQKDTHRVFRELVEFEMGRNPEYKWFTWPWKSKAWQIIRSKLMWSAVRIWNKFKSPKWG